MAKTYQIPYVQNPNISWGTILAANTAKDGTGTVITIFTAGPNGSKVDQIKVRALGTNVASVLRLFVNNSQSNATPANNSLIHEVSLAATTLNEAAALTDIDVTIPKNGGEVASPIPYLPAGYKINTTLGTAVAAGYQITVHGADF